MKNISIQYLRVFSMFMIVFCHLVQESHNTYIQMTAQFLNVGVFIFFAISGFLYGGRVLDTNGKSYKSWYINRWKKVFWPFYIFMLFLLLIYVIVQKPIDVKYWIFQFLNLQGLEIYVNGAEHLWFLTVMAVCYLITPLLNEWKKREMRYCIIILLLLWMIAVISSYFISTQLGIYTIYIVVYISGYVLGYKNLRIHGNSKSVLLCMAFFAAVLVRLITKVMWDETPFYTVLCVGITQSVIAVTMLLFFLSFKFRENKVVNFLDNISYEIYLVHYMFIVGPLRIIGITGSLLMDSIIVLLLTLISAFALMKISGLIMHKPDLSNSSQTGGN